MSDKKAQGGPMKSLKRQRDESLFSLVSAAIVILITIWWTWYGIAFAAGMILQAWINYGDHKYGEDDTANAEGQFSAERR